MDLCAGDQRTAQCRSLYDKFLHPVKKGQSQLGANREILVLNDRLLEANALEFFVSKIFHSLKVGECVGGWF